MNTKQFVDGARTCPAQSNRYLNPLSIFALSVHSSFHHCEHPAH
ncbi:MAG: hypothetical protein ACHQUC_02285 [Chlamydiales bacterium]